MSSTKNLPRTAVSESGGLLEMRFQLRRVSDLLELRIATD